MIKTSSTALRAELLNELRRDLVGPHSPDEQLGDRPTIEYLTGILYPAGVALDPAEDDRLEVGNAEDEEDSEADTVVLSQTMNPASLGLSFAVEKDIEQLYIQAAYGLYEQYERPNDDKNSETFWQRRQVDETIQMRLSPGNGKKDLEGGGTIEWVVRIASAMHRVSVFLVNRNQPTDMTRADDSECLFQPYLCIRGPEGSHPFKHREPEGVLPPDSDLESYQLLYRDCYEFAVGHGCAADWDEVQSSHAGVLKTAFIPSYELPATLPNDMVGLEMRTLAEASMPSEVSALLNPVLYTYEAWIDKRRTEIADLTPDLQSTASIHLERCSEALTRMRAGLELLQRDTQVFEAFRFANRAMLLQRSRSQWVQHIRRTGKRTTANPALEGAWRPFQIAFILLNLNGIANPKSSDRDLVDLLWFPTGGGKTEAYLGLAAFTIALRRLRGSIDGMRGDGGVTIIMRYTLRLLTTQQFQRAATLICACEYLRRQKPQKWGQEPFQIGLWVGAGATPNNLTDAKDALEKLRNGGEVLEGNPVQLPFCPWCGEDLTFRNYHIDNDRERMVLVCPRKECTFYGNAKMLDRGIPALLIDDDIYHQCPTLLLATVDKFARLPWKPQTMALFGKVDRFCARHGYLVHADRNHSMTHRAKGALPAVRMENCTPFLPPELIIQDELHLISGPLGTLTGLYETAIDMLCTPLQTRGTAIRPKIVASTATIRRAEEQVQGLFARGVRLFPPSGLHAGDSFFATAQPLTQKPGRCYVGVYAPGRSVKTALVRVYALLLQVAYEMLTRYGVENADAYTTLIGYFNSLRELGGALRLVEDDIIQRLEYLAERRGQQKRNINHENCELTSHISSHKIPEILKLLEQPAGTPRAIDVMLATNMISVGVDINRLGLMVVNGQPKTSAEYIQATSRVGRQENAPGLVVIVYNWSRPRDLSHYERFRSYHEAIYRHVEATSVTPFAPRARDRGLHAVMIALARILQPNWSDYDAASRFDPFHPIVQSIRSYIHERAEKVDRMALQEVDSQLATLIDWWQSLIDTTRRSGTNLWYQQLPFRNNPSVQVLMHPAEEKGSGRSLPTLNSLREVEGESQLFIKWVEQRSRS